MKKLLRKLSVLMVFVITVTLIPVQILPVSADEVQVQAATDRVYSTVDEAAEYLREQLLAMEENITVRISRTAVDDLYNVIYELMDKAVEYKRGDSGRAGDALKSVRNGWGCNSSLDSVSYIISYNVNYLTTAQQEAQLTEAVNNALAGLDLENKTTYEKIKSIYDYICDHVDYDYDGLADSSNIIKYTAYSALINGKAVCEGYATLFYRMCMDAGISARVISGTANGGLHAWNIVEINGYYYNVDVTWDGQDSSTRHDYFLNNMLDFSDHERNDEFTTAEFNAEFPMSEKSYVDYSSRNTPLNRENYDYTFDTIDGTAIDTSASGKPKVLIFFSSGCSYSSATIKSVAALDFSDVDVVCINILSSGDTVATKSFRDSYASGSSIDFCAYTSWNNTAMWAYTWDMPGYTGGSITMPVIAYIDADNKLQMVKNGYSGAGTVREYIDYYCKGIKFEPGHNHIYSDKWSNDSVNHWHSCVAEGCAENSADGTVAVGDKAAHTAGDWITDREATVDAEGSRHKECKVCGYVMQTESIDKLAPVPTEPETPAPDKAPEIDMDADTSKYYNLNTNGGTWDGTHYYLTSGQMVRNSFFSDGPYTYYLQADGTPMKDRLTYHPDGVHIIYFDTNGHEVFSNFSHISRSISGANVDDMCFFDMNGYMYVDTLTYDMTGTKLYYVNPYGVLERNGWFQFSGHEFEAGLGFSGKAGGYGYANWDCSLMVNTNTYDWNGNLVYMQGDGHMAQ